MGGMRTLTGEAIFRAGTALKEDEVLKKFNENPHYFAQFDLSEQCVESKEKMALLRRLLVGYKQKIALIKDDEKKQATRFYEFLTAKKNQDVFLKAGFTISSP
jgi:ABC-type molybdate transport system substrate-binding protein